MQQGEETIQENKMGTMPVNRLLITMSIPMIISMLVQALYNVVDSVFVSQINENALTAVSMAFPIQNLMIAVAVGTGVGTNALLSRSLGEKNQDMANKAANNSVFLACASYVIFLILGLTSSELFYRLQTDIPEIINYGREYVFFVCVLSFGLFLQVAFDRLLQATGRTFYTMFTQGSGAIINIILDPILIFGWFGFPRMEVTGAALATVIGQIIAMIISAVMNVTKNADIQLKFKTMRPDKEVFGRIYSVGLPSIVMSSIASVMTFCMNKILMSFSSTATAVFGVYFKLQSFVFMPVFGLNNGMVPIIAFNYGAKQKQRIMKTMKLAMMYAFGMMLIGLVIFQLCSSMLLEMFNASDAMLSIGVPALRIISISFLFAAFSIISISMLQALGHGIYSMLISVGRQLIVLIPVAYLLSKTGNLNLVWLAFPLAEIMAISLSSVFLRKVLKSLDF
ncbi:MATE family efflux transporter [Frisingicoccus caecimuris]|uniref:Probable multidrug resistance protein NorM n=1 Tax=Frisingicoccus caecimuris TaxID=1796636 RepID=A0A4R2LZ77_9FIRM|nr:MATE family efflux transporter [Frisingicoccus caecimuris]MCR1917581.1 MATE family efflux transporter [Frisingicoccus caecimuris]TCO85851.1 putative MATE family efflux protein [Frisingicoccus caecimuris]